jgi:hypothetical protein
MKVKVELEFRFVYEKGKAYAKVVKTSIDLNEEELRNYLVADTYVLKHPFVNRPEMKMVIRFIKT